MSHHHIEDQVFYLSLTGTSVFDDQQVEWK